MISSMTGYGSASQVFKRNDSELEFSVEVKSVNSKFLDVQIRSPRALIPIERQIIQYARSKFKRGRVDIFISRRVLEGKAEDIQVNLSQAKALYSAFEKVMEANKIGGDIQLANLLAVPDWLSVKDIKLNLEEEWKLLEGVVGAACDQAILAREAEGKSLEKFIISHRQEFEEVFNSIAGLTDELTQKLRLRLKERIEKLQADQAFDAQRIEQEIAVWVARSDFTEEIDRIRHHLQSFDKIFKKGGEVGRRVEFLVQELHREVNTLGSKCPDAQETHKVISMKSLIERIKEQIQNVE